MFYTRFKFESHAIDRFRERIARDMAMTYEAAEAVLHQASLSAAKLKKTAHSRSSSTSDTLWRCEDPPMVLVTKVERGNHVCVTVLEPEKYSNEVAIPHLGMSAEELTEIFKEIPSLEDGPFPGVLLVDSPKYDFAPTPFSGEKRYNRSKAEQNIERILEQEKIAKAKVAKKEGDKAQRREEQLRLTELQEKRKLAGIELELAKVQERIEGEKTKQSHVEAGRTVALAKQARIAARDRDEERKLKASLQCVLRVVTAVVACEEPFEYRKMLDALTEVAKIEPRFLEEGFLKSTLYADS